jgi:hypothetical protein
MKFKHVITKEDAILENHTLVCHTCYMITILARIMSSHDFITFKAKIGIKELGNDVYFKNMKFFIVETEEIRRK